MSTSLLYHAFRIRGYKFVRSFFDRGRIIFRARQERHQLRCPVCRSRRINLKGSIKRTFGYAPIVFKPVFIEFAIPRIECLDCGVIRQVKLGFADERRSYTRQFERLALGLCCHMTIKDVANFLSVSWDTIKEIQKRYLKRRFSRPSLKGIKRLAIDEIYIGSKEKYLTIVMDLDRGAVVFVSEGKGGDALVPFLEAP
ncbi:MAG: helix-turn-helix domain-containing protein [Pseudomonadota bacterium]